MMCERCGKNQANTHVKRVINGQVYEARLCSECAAQMGFASLAGTLNLGSLLGSTFTNAINGNASAINNQPTCPVCGATFNDITETGLVGCAKCYEVFYDRLLPSLQRIHGKTNHVGKLPGCAGEKAKVQSKLDELKNQLAKAIEQQEYEKAAEIRDEIKEIEAKEDR